MGIIAGALAKRQRVAAVRELHKRIVADSIAMAQNVNNAHVIDDYRNRKLRHSAFLLYPIQLNKEAKYTQYIHAALTDDSKVTTPLSWETIRFLKDSLQVDLEAVHQIGFERLNDGQSNRPFSQCYSMATIVWDDKGVTPEA